MKAAAAVPSIASRRSVKNFAGVTLKSLLRERMIKYMIRNTVCPAKKK